MSDPVIISTIGAISSITITILTVVVKGLLDRRAKEREKHDDEAVQPIDISEMLYVADFIEDFRTRNDFDRVAVSQFHNGGKFFNGKSMKKFSMTYEACALGISKIKREHQNLLVSEFPKLFSAMMEEDIIEICKDSTQFVVVARDMSLYGIVQNIIFPIRGLKGDLVGFISCHNLRCIDDTFNDEKIEDFANVANQISGYLIK